MNINIHLTLALNHRLFCTIIFFLFISKFQIAFAQDYLLDPLFSNHGKQLTTGGKGDNTAVFIHRLKDRKILFGANAPYGKFSNLTLIRLESNGKVDSSFGHNGIVLSDVIPPYYYGHNIQLDTLENIYIGGSSRYLHSDFWITKFNKSGKQDLTFANQGYLYFEDIYNHGRFQIKIRNNQIYVLSNLNSQSYYPFDLQKFDLNGIRDNSFGQNGSIVLTGSGAAELEVTTDDKLIVAGGDDRKIIIKTYLQNGSLDSSFGLNGTVIYNDTILKQSAEEVFLQNDQSILITGSGVQIPNGYKFISRFTEHGVLDTTFANKGFLKIVNGSIFPDRLHVYSDDQYITIIHGERPDYKNFITIKQYYLNGAINTFFADSGKLSLEFPERSPWNGDAYMDKDGNFLLGNSLSVFSNPSYLQISSINADGKPNTSFGYNGKFDLFFGYNAISSSEILPLGNSGFIQGATQVYGWGSNIQLNKFTNDGIPDSTWSTNGISTIPRQRVFLYNQCGVIQPDGKILIGGSESYDSATDAPDQMYVCRLLNDGSLDSSFAINGVNHIYDRYHSGSSVDAIALERNGNILVGGFATIIFPSLIRLDNNGSVKLKFERMKNVSNWICSKILIAKNDKIYNVGVGYNSNTKLLYSHVTRFLPDGTLDLQFGDSASTRISSPMNSIIIQSAALDQQERIILVGYDTIQGIDSSMFACRLLTNGIIDTTFADKGFFRYKVNKRNSAFSDILIDKQGRIYIGGVGYKTNTRDFILLCLGENGKLQNTFGENGLVYADFYGGNDYVTSMIFDSDENIILGGNSESTEAYYMALAKVINKLNVGTLDDASNPELQFIYPNPVTDRATLKFSLNHDQNITIDIADLTGNTVRRIINQKYFNTGDHKIELQMPKDIITGYYFISIHTATQNKNIKFFKL